MSKGIAKLKYRINLCRQKDTYVDGGVLVKRAGVLMAWAQIESMRTNTFSIFGAAVGSADTVRTHVVTIRYDPMLDISNLAWIYEDRRKSGPRWYKVLGVYEKELRQSRFYVMDCRLVEKGLLSAEPLEVQDGIASWGRI